MDAAKDEKDQQTIGQQPHQEALLEDYVERIKKFREGRVALHVQISCLRPRSRDRDHLRVAGQAFDKLVQAHEGAFFQLFDDDLVVILKGAPTEKLSKVSQRLHDLFKSDPALAGPKAPEGGFVQRWSLETEFEALAELAHRKAVARGEVDTVRNARLEEIAPANPAEGDPFTPQQLVNLEAAIAQADLTNFTRRQAVCAVAPREKPQPVFREVYVSVSDLRDTLLPGGNLATDRWLFQYLTQVLDLRLIALLSAGADILREGHISLNLNISSVTSPAFLKLDEALNQTDRQNVIIELQVIDVFANLSRFAFARDFLSSKGYRICLDGCTHLTVQHINRQRLGIDFIKMAWHNELLDHLGGPQGDELREVIKRLGSQRVILNRCDAPEAMAAGQTLGIYLYQGYYLDALLEEDNLRHKPVQVLKQAKS